MKVLVVEDEYGVARNLCDLLQELEPGIEILAILESVEETLRWLKTNKAPELGFFDIRLADGNSFDIFQKTHIDFPVIFTTAYDEFALNAFKVNSIDYLLKPIDKKALKRSMEKYRSLQNQLSSFNNETFLKVIEELKGKKQLNYKKSLLVNFKDKIIPIHTENIAYFRLRDEVLYCVTRDNKHHVLDQSLEKIMAQLDPLLFFRANRQFIISKNAIKDASRYFNRKILLNIIPSPDTEILIGKTRIKEFKQWLES